MTRPGSYSPRPITSAMTTETERAELEALDANATLRPNWDMWWGNCDTETKAFIAAAPRMMALIRKQAAELSALRKELDACGWSMDYGGGPAPPTRADLCNELSALRESNDLLCAQGKAVAEDVFALTKENTALRERLEAAERDAWVSVAERMPGNGVTVLAYFKNSADKNRRIRAYWIARHTHEDSDERDEADYNEETDTYYYPEGWYEASEESEEDLFVTDTITHWMPMPPPPRAIDSASASAEKGEGG